MATDSKVHIVAPTIERLGNRNFIEVRAHEGGRRLIDPTRITQVLTNCYNKVVLRLADLGGTDSAVTIHEYDEFIPVFRLAMRERLPNDPLTTKTGDDT